MDGAGLSPTFLLLCVVCSSPVTLTKKQIVAHTGPRRTPGSHIIVLSDWYLISY